MKYFSQLLGESHNAGNFPEDIQLPTLSHAQIDFSSRPFHENEILSTFKSMAKNKSPGPDGFTAEFFVAAWQIIGKDVEKAILHFFNTGSMPRIIHSTAISLVPKVQNPSVMSDFRPISCCNVLYKCISNMLAQRLKLILQDIISPFQSAFLPKRRMGDNIMLVQALCKDYHLHTGPPRCAIKVDIHKAFDSLSWNFLFSAMQRMNFPKIFIDWVYNCITTAMFSVKVNGSLEGFFKGASGLRQGDPLSPYLFVIAMEVLTGCLKQFTASAEFKPHWRTKEIALSHLIFADDVFLFCRGEENSVQILQVAMDLFFSISGLQPNLGKSQCFLGQSLQKIKVLFCVSLVLPRVLFLFLIWGCR